MYYRYDTNYSSTVTTKRNTDTLADNQDDSCLLGMLQVIEVPVTECWLLVE